MKPIRLIDIGTIDYKEAWDYQCGLFDKLIKGEGESSLILCEHPHVYTLGRHGDRNNVLVSEDFLKSIGASFYEVDRGGDITYHGYGQLVGYPIISLSDYCLNLKEYIYTIEEAVINTVAHYGFNCQRIDGATGVWYRDKERERKICAIGVKASRYTTMHGFALNINTDLKYFNYINPCGFTEKGVTSLKELCGGEDVDIECVKKIFCEELSTLIGAEIRK